MLDTSIGFVGGGQMARALARGFVAAGLVKPARLSVYDVAVPAAEGFANVCGGAVIAETLAELCSSSDVILLAVKPQHMDAVLEAVQSSVDGEKLVISVAAGVPLAQLEDALPEARVIRVMPNTPCLVRKGVSAFALGSRATANDLTLTKQLLGAVGIAHQVNEPHLDAVTGLSGSGPAFVYLAIEALADGGVQAGLPRQIAAEFAAQTVLGAAQMVLETGDHPAVLKDRVTSPAGTTIAGLHELEKGGVRAAFMEAVQAATARSQEMSQSQGDSPR